MKTISLTHHTSKEPNNLMINVDCILAIQSNAEEIEMLNYENAKSTIYLSGDTAFYVIETMEEIIEKLKTENHTV